MKEKRLLKAMGKVDGKYIEEASPVQHAKRPGWLKWGAIAACLLLVCAAVVRFSSINHTGDEVIEPGVADLAPMVYVNDTLYIQSSDQQGYPELKDEFVYLGKIESTASEASTPKENFQANHPVVGCEVYQYGENIVVHINDAYWLYTKYGES